MSDHGTEGSQTAEIDSVTSGLSAFVLSVSTEEEPVTVTSASGTSTCPDSCSFAYVAGTSLTLQAGLQNLADCLRFSGWDGACAGQGQTCSLVINSDLSTRALYRTRITGCVRQ